MSSEYNCWARSCENRTINIQKNLNENQKFIRLNILCYQRTQELAASSLHATYFGMPTFCPLHCQQILIPDQLNQSLNFADQSKLCGNFSHSFCPIWILASSMLHWIVPLWFFHSCMLHRFYQTAHENCFYLLRTIYRLHPEQPIQCWMISEK